MKKPQDSILGVLTLAICLGLGAVIAVITNVTSPREYVSAQGGNVGLQTVQQVLTVPFFPAGGSPRAAQASAADGSVFVVRNIGQASHWFYYCTAAPIVALTVEIEASYDGIFWTAISEQNSNLGCNTIEAGGYYPQVRFEVYNLNAGGNPGNMSVFYSGSAGAIPASGAARGNKSPQPVIMAAGNNFTSTALKSTAATIDTNPAALLNIDAYNPNASLVYVVVSGTAGVSPAVYPIPIGPLARNIPLGPGVNLAANSTVACATNPNGTGDPATGCVVTMAFRDFPPQNANISNSGTVSGTQSSQTRQ